MPNLVYSGRDNSFIRYLSSLGVKVLFHRSSFEDAINAASPRQGFNKDWAAGNFLRFDIPLLERDEDHVLYTDTDVVFCSDVTSLPMQGVIAAANEFLIDGVEVKERSDVFNAGVMVLNMPVLRQLHRDILDLTIANDFARGAAGWYDQGILNGLFADHRVPLSPAMNWRPFAKTSLPPAIIHFHYLKPFEVWPLRKGSLAAQDLNDVQRRLYAEAPEHYAWAFEIYQQHLHTDAIRALAESYPASPLSTLSGRRP
nr:glycosyltransferase [Methylobacterium sp. V23]